MIDKIKDEASEIYAFSKRNYRQIVVICLAVLFLVLNRYHPITPEWLGSLIYYLVLPISVIIILLRRNPIDYGLRAGDWRLWGWYMGITAIVAVPVLYAASRFSQLSDYYITESFVMWRYSLEMAAYLFGWEFLFRGFLLFGLKEKLQEASNTIDQAEVRTRVIERKLSKVQELPQTDSAKLMEPAANDDEDRVDDDS